MTHYPSTMSMNLGMVVIRGRSIDGTVYYAGNGCWTSVRREAMRFRNGDPAAQDICNIRRMRNTQVDTDSIIGHIEMVVA